MNFVNTTSPNPASFPIIRLKVKIITDCKKNFRTWGVFWAVSVFDNLCHIVHLLFVVFIYIINSSLGWDGLRTEYYLIILPIQLHNNMYMEFYQSICGRNQGIVTDVSNEYLL